MSECCPKCEGVLVEKVSGLIVCKGCQTLWQDWKHVELAREMVEAYEQFRKRSQGDIINNLRDQLATANEVIAKLPKYADTGESFVPGHDAAYVVANGALDDGLIYPVKSGRWMANMVWGYTIAGSGHNQGTYGPAYSTREAAAAAATKETEK